MPIAATIANVQRPRSGDQRRIVGYPRGGGWSHYVRRRRLDGWWHAREVSAGSLVLRGLRLVGSGSAPVTVNGRAVEAAVTSTGPM